MLRLWSKNLLIIKPCPYEKNQTLFEQNQEGSYTLDLLIKGQYYILSVGNGAGGGSSQRDSKWFQSSGGSGATFEAIVSLPDGRYTVNIGKLGFGYNINNRLSCTGGEDSSDTFLLDPNGVEILRTGCGIRGTSHTSGGNGGIVTLGNINIVHIGKSINGNKGTNINNGSVSQASGYALSSFDNTKTGLGAGTGSWRGGGNVYGVAGCFKIIYMGR